MQMLMGSIALQDWQAILKGKVVGVKVNEGRNLCPKILFYFRLNGNWALFLQFKEGWAVSWFLYISWLMDPSVPSIVTKNKPYESYLMSAYWKINMSRMFVVSPDTFQISLRIWCCSSVVIIIQGEFCCSYNFKWRWSI